LDYNLPLAVVVAIGVGLVELDPDAWADTEIAGRSFTNGNVIDVSSREIKNIAMES
jgi:hypothetical protein